MISIDCHFCGKTVENKNNIVKYTDTIYFYWCSCSLGTVLYRSNKHEKEKAVSLSVGRGEKLPVSKGAGLTAKGRAKYNRETGSNLKAPQPQGGPRKSRSAQEWVE